MKIFQHALSVCALCKNPAADISDLCAPCWAQILKQIKDESENLQIGTLHVFSLALYHGKFKEYVHFLKGSGSNWKINTLNTIENLVSCLPRGEEFFNAKSVCSIPSSRMREIDSFSISIVLGLEISKQFKIPVLHPQPRRSLWADIFFETDQKNKVYNDRAKVSSLWRWPKTQLPCPNSQGALTCILIDDIVTTGASLLGMQRELTERGYRVQNALTLLRAPLLLPNRKL